MKEKMLRTIQDVLGKVARQLMMILGSLVFVTVFLWLFSYPPFAIIEGLINAITKDFAGTIRWSIPLILAGLAICVSYKAKVFNLGVDGQLYVGAAAATSIALQIPSNTNSFLSVVIVMLVAMLAAAAFALIPALMKVYLGTNEVVSTLLLNFIAVLFVEALVTGPLMDTTSATNLNASPVIPENTFLPRLASFQPSSANIGIYFALFLVILISFIFHKTRMGYEIKIVGSNSTLAKYAGMNPKKTILQVMMISGSIAGLIGFIEVTAIQHRLLAGFNPGFGFDGIVVSLLANNNPLGVVLTGFFFGALKNGGINMERYTDVPSAITEIVMAGIIITISAKLALPKFLQFMNNRKLKKIQRGSK